jgi:sugar/nucleoside kinase (ribokinase family)
VGLVRGVSFVPTPTPLPDEAVLTRAVSYAVAASALTCTRTGAVPPTRDEIEAQLRVVELAGGPSA